MFKSLSNEVWKDIEGYEGLYQVSNLGRVRSLNYLHTGQMRVLKQCFYDRKGYLGVNLYKNGKSKHPKVHRLVAIAFIPNPLNLPCINHKDENKENNCVENLEWCSVAYNNTYANRHKKVAEKLCGILTNRADQSKRVAQYTLGGELVSTYPSIMEAARQTRFSQGNICDCCREKHRTAYGYIWKYIEKG